MLALLYLTHTPSFPYTCYQVPLESSSFKAHLQSCLLRKSSLTSQTREWPSIPRCLYKKAFAMCLSSISRINPCPLTPFLFFLFPISYRSWGMYPSCPALCIGAQRGVGPCLHPLRINWYFPAQLFLSDSLQCLTQNSLCGWDPLMHADLEKPPKVANVTLLFNSKDAGNGASFA